DILFQNSDGRVHVWLMNGKDFVRGVPLRPTAGAWRLFTLADFDNNGSQDFIWQNLDDRRVAIWYMNGTNFMSGAQLPKLTKNLFVVGAGDFNHDGQRDLIIQDFSNGTVRARLLNGINLIRDTTFVRPTGLGFSPDLRVVGTMDMDGDGEPDLLVRHTSGEVFVWFLNGTTITHTKSIVPPNPLWNVVGHR
ncbi:MAG: FG-GAP repeat domain-containing protein, partial [Limisphaerales bacterium]